MSALPMHALHPVMVHLPLIAFALAVFLDGLDTFAREPRWRPAGTLVWWLALAGAGAAIATGLIAYGRVDHSEAGHRVMTLHRNLALGSVAVLLVAALRRWRVRRSKLAVAVGAVGVAGLVVVGLLGGELVFRHGIGIPTSRLAQLEEERGSEGPGHAHEPGDAAAPEHRHDAGDRERP